MWEFWTSTTPVARQPHRCDDCGGEIATGEKYARTDGKYDGYMQSWKDHLGCLASMRALAKAKGLALDEWPVVDDLEMDDLEWLAENMPEESARIRERLLITRG